MKVTSVKINRENKNVEIIVSSQIPFTEYKKAGSDFDLDAVRSRNTGYNMDLLGAFSKRIIASLQRRMDACLNNLQNHIDDIVYCDEIGCILYKRKDGSHGRFNLPSYTCMVDCVAALKQSNYKTVLREFAWIDQIIKALLNDTEQNHSDEGIFKWSDLVSLLTELHMFGCRHENA